MENANTKGNIGVWVTAIIVLILAIVGGFFLFRGGSAGTTPDVSDNSPEDIQGEEFPNLGTAPAFALEDYEGNIVTNEDFAGKVLVINSWATWCPFCVDEIPDFVTAQEEFGEDVIVIAIDRAESEERAIKFTDDLNVSADSLIFLLDPSDSFYASIGGFSMPETIFVDTEGNVRIHKRGPMPLEEIQEKIRDMLEA